MKAMNRLLEAANFRKYRKYIERDFLPAIERYLGFKLSPVIGSDSSYGRSYKTITSLDGEQGVHHYVNLLLTFTTNDISLKGDKALVVDLVVNGRSYPSYISCQDVEEDINSCCQAFEKASRDFDIDISLDDIKLEESDGLDIVAKAVDEFNDSEKTLGDYEKVLNIISKLEWNNKISRAQYDEYLERVKKILASRDIKVER